MYNYLYITLFVLCCIYTSNAQTRDFPTFPSPQNDFYKLLDEKKVLNPIYLKGPVRDVNRTYILHISPDNEEVYMTNYFYRLKRDKEITEYITNDRYDDTTIPYLNQALRPAVQHDTIIKEDFYTYMYTDGKLMKYMAYDVDGGTRDSIVYTYKKDHLHTRTHYRSQGAIDVVFLENGEIDDSTMYFPEFSIYAYDKARYNKKGQIRSLKQYEFTVENDLVDGYQYSYNYDDKGRFESIEAISNRYFLTFKQLRKHPKKWKLKNNDTVDGMYLETIVNVSYDIEDNIQTYVKTDSNKNRESYNVTYSNYFDKVIQVARDDYDQYNDVLIHRDLMYEYVYDEHHNPTDITSYIIVDGEKILDKSTRLQISYY
ncbi:hypothetical protein [uncultured Dokdonia sp.]|uniref:hypothetical protein n=1 Tax=uncultured Dokdonia sp. TaxID=575653 RepID=UPI0026279059|nr:hypothetical protein [uncultured Dokdonia sp.]